MAVLEGTTQPEPNPIPVELDTAAADATTVSQPYTDLASSTLTQPPPTYDPYTSAATQVGTDVSFQDTVTTKPTSDYVAPESLVSNQLTSLLDSNSPLMARAAERSKEEANSLGLLSSSMAVGAAQGAMMDRALPIAQQDAQTYATLQQQQQQTENQGLLQGQQAYNTAQGNVAEGIVSAGLTAHSAAINQANQNMQNAFTASMKSADAQGQVMLNDVNNRWNYFIQTSLTDYTKQWDERFLQGQVEQERYNTAMNSANQIMQNTQTAITTLMQDPDIMSQDPAAVANMFNTIYDQSQASMEFIGGLGAIPQPEFDTMLEAFNLAVEFGTTDVVQTPIV